MKPLLTFLVFIVSSSVLAQQSFKTEVERLFVNIPIDSSFEKLASYAVDNDFTHIVDKSMDSSEITYVLSLKQKDIYHIPLVSSYLHFNYSDSLFAGDSFYKKSSSISYRIKVKNYRSFKKVYNRLVEKFSPLYSTKEMLKNEPWPSGDGIRFYNSSSDILQLIVSTSLRSFDGYVITVTYLRKGVS